MSIGQFKCPACGGALEFDPNSQMVKCPYCDSAFAPEEIESVNHTSATDGVEYWGNKPQEDNTNFGTTFGEEAEELLSYVCQSCGGEIIGNKTLAATLCPYCGNPVVVNNAFEDEFKPDYLIPFVYSKDQAMQAYGEFVKTRHFVPNEFKLKSFSDRICGLYIPFWLYDAHISGSANFHCENSHFWSDAEYNYRETKEYSVSRDGEEDFYRVPCDASSKMDDALMDSIEPYDWSQLVPFSTSYLAGFLAHKYDVAKEDNLERAHNRMKNSFIDDLRADAGRGYESCVLRSSQVAFSNEKAHYALLPLWFLKTVYKDQDYHFAMNGQTGKMQGTVPVSNVKATLWWLVFAILAAVGVFFLGRYFWEFAVDTRSIALSAGAGSIISLIPNLLLRFSGRVRELSQANGYVDMQSFNILFGNDQYLGSHTSRTKRNN